MRFLGDNGFCVGKFLVLLEDQIGEFVSCRLVSILIYFSNVLFKIIKSLVKDYLSLTVNCKISVKIRIGFVNEKFVNSYSF